MNFIASVGWLRTNGTNSRRSMVNSSQLLLAVASALRTQSVEQRHLAENLARPDHVEDGVAPVGRGNADLHRSTNHRKQAGAGITLGKERGAPLQRGMLGIAAELLESIRLEIGKNTGACAGPTACCWKTRGLLPCCPEARQSNSRQMCWGSNSSVIKAGWLFNPESISLRRFGGDSTKTYPVVTPIGLCAACYCKNSRQFDRGWSDRPPPPFIGRNHQHK